MVLPVFKELKDSFESSSRAIDQTAFLLSITQSTTILLLASILVVLFGILVTVNPDLQAERERIVTPVVRRVLGVGSKAKKAVASAASGTKLGGEAKDDAKAKAK